MQLELVAIGDDVDAARAVASALGAVAYADTRPDTDGLPFRTLVRAVTDDPDALAAAGNIGLYVVAVRTMRAQPTRCATFTINAMVRHPHLTRGEADAHWRDAHGPLALRRHVGMAYYVQLPVVQTIAGPAYHGFAVLGFETADDFRNRFFDGPEGKAAILADVAKFSDPQRSPRRLVATELAL